MIIEIVKAPSGDTPQWVRDAWVGLQLPALEDRPVSMPTVSAQTGPKSLFGQLWHLRRGKTERRYGFVVNAKTAIGLLALSNEEAARWWIDTKPLALNPAQVLMFDANCCKPVDTQDAVENTTPTDP